VLEVEPRSRPLSLLHFPVSVQEVALGANPPSSGPFTIDNLLSKKIADLCDALSSRNQFSLRNLDWARSFKEAAGHSSMKYPGINIET
jgi:hypothetical protein